MSRKPTSKRTRPKPKAVLRLPDLDQAKSAVLNSLTSADAQRGYRHAIDEFVEWYCSEPRLSFSRTVVLRYRIHLESRNLAPGTINLRLGAVRRLAYEAADCGLLSPDLAAGIRRVKGVKKIGVRLGNWLTAEQSQRLWQTPGSERLKEKRDRALLAVLLACGLRRHEAVELNLGHIQQREEHWAIVDLKGKAGHTRTIPMPGWVKDVVDHWIQAANITSGKLFRRVHKMGKTWGERLTEKGGLARGSGVCPEGWDRQASPARPPQNLCTALLRCRRRTGTNPVSARSRFNSDHRTISRLQTADSRCRQRQNRNRTTGMTECSLSALPTIQG
jgi:integrase